MVRDLVVGGERGRGGSVDMKLFTQMEEEAGRFTGETASGSKDKVGGNQEIGDVGGVDFAGDSRVVAGWACVLEDGPSIGGEPDKTKDSSVQRGSGCIRFISNGGHVRRLVRATPEPSYTILH